MTGTAAHTSAADGADRAFAAILFDLAVVSDNDVAHSVAVYPSTVELLHRLQADGVTAGLVTAGRNGATTRRRRNN